MVNLQGTSTVRTLKTDLVYFPSAEISLQDDGRWMLHEPRDHGSAGVAEPVAASGGDDGAAGAVDETTAAE